VGGRLKGTTIAAKRFEPPRWSNHMSSVDWGLRNRARLVETVHEKKRPGKVGWAVNELGEPRNV
jgi:hypothetical protein